MDDRSPDRPGGNLGKVDIGRSEAPSGETPVDLARRLKDRSRAQGRANARQAAASEPMGSFVRHTYALPRLEARERARDWFSRYPKAAYMTKVESWRQLDDGRIEFTMRRLPTAD
jgi:hypothetical protein